MKKLMLLVLCIAVFTAVAVAQTPVYSSGSGTVTGGIHDIDKLGAHQNGGRGCVGCHAPHSGARGNGGSLKWDTGTSTWVSQAVTDDESGDEVLWGQDLGPLYGKSIATGAGGAFGVTFGSDFSSTPERISTGIMMCLSCHDGNLAKGAMMTNQSFEQTANLLPDGYGTQPIPTLLGNDGSTAGNYSNDHPIGPKANIGALGANVYNSFTIVNGAVKEGTLSSAYAQFKSNYGLPTLSGSRAGAGFAVDSGVTDVKQAYVVCTTCHTPHSMYTASASSTNPIGGATTGVFPSYFFVAAPYNPGANVADGTHASSATQFCRQCHFTGAGGSNEGSGIMGVKTAF